MSSVSNLPLHAFGLWWVCALGKRRCTALARAPSVSLVSPATAKHAAPDMPFTHFRRAVLSCQAELCACEKAAIASRCNESKIVAWTADGSCCSSPAPCFRGPVSRLRWRAMEGCVRAVAACLCLPPDLPASRRAHDQENVSASAGVICECFWLLHIPLPLRPERGAWSAHVQLGACRGSQRLGSGSSSR